MKYTGGKAVKKTIAMIVSVCFVFGGCGSGSTQDPGSATASAAATETARPTEDTVMVSANPARNVGDGFPVSRALVAKMLTMAYSDLNSINRMEREIAFADVSPDSWYDKYVNAAFVDGLMVGAGDKFMPEEPITLGQAQTLLDTVNPENKVKLQISGETRDKPISYAVWIDLYKKFLEGMSDGKSLKEMFGIEEKTFVVMATPGNNNKLSGYDMITDIGPATFAGLNMDSYIDKEIRVLRKNGDVLAVLSVESDAPTIKNAYIVRTDSMTVTVFSGGAERTYNYVNTMTDSAGKICDIKINDGAAEYVTVYDKRINDTVKKTTASVIELQSEGPLQVDENFKVYSIADGAVKWRGLSDLTVGSDIADFVIGDNGACVAVITKKAPLEKIRVAINNTGFTSLYHDKVALSCTRDFTVSYGGNETVLKAWEVFNVEPEHFGSENIISVKSNAEEGRIVITSIKRNWTDNESPKYRGLVEVINGEEGYVIVNEVDMEEYLYAVVPSEMPTSFGVEAAKIQAITARSYAYNQYFANRYHNYGANVDDSIICQVYNNIPENETSITAVDATRGKCLTYSGQVISANFYSTSSGVGANGGEVWVGSGAGDFPAHTHEYLSSTKQYDGDSVYDLKTEQGAAEFFKSKDISGYDSGFGWFRWNVEMSAEELTASINAVLKSRYNANPTLIKTLQGGNVFRSRPVESIGKLKYLEVTKRGQGGNIMEMKITGSDATVLVQTEYNVRALLRPAKQLEGGRDINVTLKDGTLVKNFVLLPSAFFTMERMTDNNGDIVSVKFYGGGNGHGVGMSQNGAKGMIDRGFGAEEIMGKYYPGTVISKVY